jgi:V8-like Glu-specific endopeptidase
MKRLIPLLLATVVLGTASYAADNPRQSFKPAALPAAGETEADLSALATPQAPMSQFVAPASGMTPQMMIDGLSALKGSRDGTQSEVKTPRRVKRMLMGKQSGMIGGKDDKKKKKSELTRIGNTAEYPYSTMGVVASGCTGAVVMKRFVLTAAWCVYDLKNKKFYDNLNFFPAMNGKKTPFGEVQWKNAWVAKGFSDKGDLNFGYGLIELDQDIGDKVGWFGFGDVPKLGRTLTMTGYPFAAVPAQTMWETRCNIDGADDNAIFYRCPGEPKAVAAMLGSPIWFKGKTDDSWQIVGIHVTAQNDKMESWWAARLSKAHTETILAWANSADKKDTGTETEDEGTDDQVTDNQTDDTEDEEDTGTDQVTDTKPTCTCDEEAQPQ